MVEPSQAAVIYFPVGAAECMQRVAARTDHPTIAHGSGQCAVQSFQRMFEEPEPTSTSSNFGAMHVVGDGQAARHLLFALGAVAEEEYATVTAKQKT